MSLRGCDRRYFRAALWSLFTFKIGPVPIWTSDDILSAAGGKLRRLVLVKGSRHQCRDCKSSFAVTIGTVFHGTHIPLRNWFLIIALMLNAKKSLSACQVARDLGMRRPTVWSIMHRIRAAMALDPEQKRLFYGIVEADETYIGGKPRKENRKINRVPSKRGRGTSKTPVVGVLERGGRTYMCTIGEIVGIQKVSIRRWVGVKRA